MWTSTTSLAHVGPLSEFPWSPHATYWLGPWLLGLTSSPVVPPAFLETQGCPLQSHPLHYQEPRGKFHGRAKEARTKKVMTLTSTPAPGHSSSGSTQVCILKAHQRWTAVHWGTLSLVTLLGWMEAQDQNRVGKGKERLISTSGHSLVTVCLDTNNLPCKLGMTTPLLVLG